MHECTPKTDVQSSLKGNSRAIFAKFFIRWSVSQTSKLCFTQVSISRKLAFRLLELEAKINIPAPVH